MDRWPFVRRGVLGAVLSAFGPDRRGRGRGHAHTDTRDKMGDRDPRSHAVSLGEATLWTADPAVSVDRRPPGDVRGALDEGYERELRAGGRWPFDG